MGRVSVKQFVTNCNIKNMRLFLCTVYFRIYLLQEYIWTIKSQKKSNAKRCEAGRPSFPQIILSNNSEAVKNAQLEEKGINIDGEKLSNLRSADDVALTTEDVKDMEHHLNTVNEESVKIGLKIHRGKTKYMTNIDTTENIQINKTEIEKVTNYKYLG